MSKLKVKIKKLADLQRLWPISEEGNIVIRRESGNSYTLKQQDFWICGNSFEIMNDFLQDGYIWILIKNEHDYAVMFNVPLELIDVINTRKESKSLEKDVVNHPEHYKTKSGLETIDVIRAFTEDLVGIEAVDTAQVIKYICRWKKKNGLEDLKKAKWYLDDLIEYVEQSKAYSLAGMYTE